MADPGQVGDRIDMVYRSSGPGGERDVELPFRVMVLGDFTLDQRAAEAGGQESLSVTGANLDAVMASLDIHLDLRVPDCLSDGGERPLDLSVPLRSIADFSPARLFANLPGLDGVRRLRNLLSDLREERVDATAFRAALGQLLGEGRVGELLAGEGPDTLAEESGRGRLAFLLADIDQRLGRQMDAILHDARFVALESAWRALAFLVERVDFNENCEVSLHNSSKQGLLEDFEDTPEVTQSHLYQSVYTSEFGQFGGRPYSVLIGNYDFGPGAADVKLLQQIAAVAAMAHAPFVGAAAPALFDIDGFADLARVRDLDAIMQQPQFAKWRSLRAGEDARFVGLTLPGFLLRRPYGDGDQGDTGFDYRERLDKTHTGLWGNSAFAFATRLTDSFARTRWCLNVAGDEAGQVAGLDLQSSGARVIPTEVLITDRRETDLVRHGFMPLTVRKGADRAAFYAAQSIQQVDEERDSHGARILSRRLGAQLPYLFIVSRLAHYIKMMQREHIGAWRNSMDIERQVNDWLKQYVSDMDNPAPAVRARRPLRQARLSVREVEGKGDWYLIDLSVMPHLKYMGSTFTLSEVGKLEKN